MKIRSVAFTALIAAFVVSIPLLSYGKTDTTALRPDAVPQNIVELLKAGKLKEAILTMREETANPKINYLMRCANEIVFFEMQKKPSQSMAHEIYQNVAIAYHNLFLFLKSRDIVQEEFFKQAEHFYNKAKKSGTYLHKADCDVLSAALIASGGDVKKAKKKFSKIDDLMLRGDYNSMEYLATYYAAVGDVDNALKTLEAAYSLSPQSMLAWINVGDDFHSIETDSRFIAMIDSWKKDSKKTAPTLSVPKRSDPHLNMIGNTDLNAPVGMSKRAKRQHIANQKQKKH
ncbi:MAG: hypothetical protein ABH871_02100 [Pseudomonadota bacterium]